MLGPLLYVTTIVQADPAVVVAAAVAIAFRETGVLTLSETTCATAGGAVGGAVVGARVVDADAWVVVAGAIVEDALIAADRATSGEELGAATIDCCVVGDVQPMNSAATTAARILASRQWPRVTTGTK